MSSTIKSSEVKPKLSPSALSRALAAETPIVLKDSQGNILHEPLVQGRFEHIDGVLPKDSQHIHTALEIDVNSSGSSTSDIVIETEIGTNILTLDQLAKLTKKIKDHTRERLLQLTGNLSIDQLDYLFLDNKTTESDRLLEKKVKQTTGTIKVLKALAEEGLITGKMAEKFEILGETANLMNQALSSEHVERIKLDPDESKASRILRRSTPERTKRAMELYSSLISAPQATEALTLSLMSDIFDISIDNTVALFIGKLKEQGLVMNELSESIGKLFDAEKNHDTPEFSEKLALTIKPLLDVIHTHFKYNDVGNTSTLMGVYNRDEALCATKSTLAVELLKRMPHLIPKITHPNIRNDNWPNDHQLLTLNWEGSDTHLLQIDPTYPSNPRDSFESQFSCKVVVLQKVKEIDEHPLSIKTLTELMNSQNIVIQQEGSKQTIYQSIKGRNPHKLVELHGNKFMYDSNLPFQIGRLAETYAHNPSLVPRETANTFFEESINLLRLNFSFDKNSSESRLLTTLLRARISLQFKELSNAKDKQLFINDAVEGLTVIKRLMENNPANHKFIIDYVFFLIAIMHGTDVTDINSSFIYPAIQSEIRRAFEKYKTTRDFNVKSNTGFPSYKLNLKNVAVSDKLFELTLTPASYPASYRQMNGGSNFSHFATTNKMHELDVAASWLADPTKSPLTAKILNPKSVTHNASDEYLKYLI